jgi:hypothetical protein
MGTSVESPPMRSAKLSKEECCLAEAADSPLLTVRPEKRLLFSSLPKSEPFAVTVEARVSLVSKVSPENKSGVELDLDAS